MAPYLSHSAIRKLQRLEVSTLGVHQLAAGLPVTGSRDRDLLAKLLVRSPRRPGSMAIPRMTWEVALHGGRPVDRRRIAELLESVIAAN